MGTLFKELFAFLLNLSIPVVLGGCVIVLFPMVFLLLGSYNRPEKRRQSPLLIVLVVVASLFAGLFLIQFLGDLLLRR